MHRITDVLHETPPPSPRLLAAGAYAAPVGGDKPVHQHTCWELVYVRTGRIGCPLGQDFYEAEAGTLLLTPPATPHTEYARTTWSCFYVWVDAPAEGPWPHLCQDDAQEAYGQVCASLVREWTSRYANRAEMLAVLLRQLDLQLRRAHEHPALSRSERVVHEVERLFHERLSTSLCVTDVAQEVGVSPTMLREYFARWRGQPPLARINALRVEHALALLRTSDFTLEAIADLCGFDSPSHLSRHVKRVTGQRPGAFRPH